MKLNFPASLFGIFAALAATVGSTGANAGAPVALYTFPGGNAAQLPAGNLVADPAGNLFGVAFAGGPHGVGEVFELSPPVAPSTTWTYAVLYSFTGGSDGGDPVAGLVRDAAGNLYGTTARYGRPNCFYCGTAFE